MAVTTREYAITTATPANIINALETALSDLGWHAATTNGYILTFSNTAGTTIAGEANKRYLVSQSATSGSGTGAVFDILRSATGAISTVTLVTGGSGYAATNTITISGADIGGTSPTDNITVTVSTIANSNGSTTTFFDKDVTTTPLTSAWSIAKIVNASNKRLGTTFWNFSVAVTTAAHVPTGGVTPTLYVRALTGFNSSANTAQGVSVLDYVSATAPNSTAVYSIALPIASNTSVPLILRVRQSGVDSNFATFSFFEGNNNRNNFFMANYNNSLQPWNLDDVFLGGVYELFSNSVFNVADAGINFRTRMTAIPKRMAEAGYGNYFQVNTTAIAYTNTFYRTSSGNRQLASPNGAYDDIMFYVRSSGDVQNNLSNMAIFKNVPICPAFAPVPYYLPEDFILAEVPFGNANIGDILEVSVGERYTVVQFALNVTTYTTLVLAARTT